MKLAIVVGHNAHAQGAVRADTGETEFVWNSRLANVIASEAAGFPGLEVKIFHRQAGLGYRGEIRQVYGETDSWGADATCELHFNASANSRATGAETLSSGSRMSLRYCEALQDEMLDALMLRDRGVKTVHTGRGSASLITGRAPAALIEPFFGSSAIGQSATDQPHEMLALARAVLRATDRVFA